MVTFPFLLCHRRAPAQQKTPWPFGAGGCERTRCGVRRQVSSRLVADAFIVRQLYRGSAQGQGAAAADRGGSGEPKRNRFPSASVCAASQTPNPGSKRSLVSPTPEARHSACKASTSSTARYAALRSASARSASP